MKKYFEIGARIMLWILGSLIILFLLLVLAIQVSSVQNFAKNKVVTFLEKKIKTKVIINKMEINLPEEIILEGIYFEDQNNDTLISVKKLAANITLYQLLNDKIKINSANLEGVTANLIKNSNSEFNFDYIIQAFASPQKSKTDSPPMEFAINEIRLDRARFTYKDAVRNNNIVAKLNHFQTKIKTFDLDKMNFEISRAKINGLKIKVKQGLEKFSKSKNIEDIYNQQQSNLKLMLGEIDLSKIDFEYQNDETKLSTAFYLNKLLAKIDKMDLNNQFAIIESLKITGFNGKLIIDKSVITTPEIATSAIESSSWQVKVNNTVLKKINFKYDNNTIAASAKGIDYNHLVLKNLNLKASTLNYNPENISGIVKSLSVKDKSGLTIQALTTDFFYGKKNAYFKKLYLKTPQTELRDEIRIGYPSIASLEKYPGELRLNANFKKSKLAIKDVLLFAPTLSNTSPFSDNANAILLIDGKIRGKLKNIIFPSIALSGIGSTKLIASGSITGLPDIDKTIFDLDIKDLQSTAKDFYSFLPKGTIPNSIQLPPKFEVKGTFNGTIADFATDMNLISSFGNAKIVATFNQTRKNFEKYNAKTELLNFDLGQLIKNDSIGKITLNATIKGTGFDPKTAVAAVTGTVIRAYYNRYLYKNLIFKGSIKNGNYNATASVEDPNLTFNLISNGNFKNKYPSTKIKLNLDIADLNKLNLYSEPLKLKGVVDADIPSASLDYLNGSIIAHDITVVNAKDQFTIDSISVIAKSTTQENTLSIKTPFLVADISGKYKLSLIRTSLTNSIASYYTSSPSFKKKAVEPQKFEFNATVKDDPILFKIVPNLKSLEPITLSGKYNSVNDSIILNGAIPKLIYGQNTITNAVLKVDKLGKALVYNFTIDDAQNNQLQLPFTSISGTVKNSVASYKMILKDLKGVERYFIAGTLKNKNGDNNINIASNNLLLNYESWQIDPKNLISFRDKGIYINQFVLDKSGSEISIQSESDKSNASIGINFKNFDISTITSFIEKNDLQFSGNVNGNATIKNSNTTAMFSSNLNIENFTFKKDTVGDISLKIKNDIPTEYNALMVISGQGNQVNLDGTYKTIQSSFDINLDIEKLNLKSIQGFTFNNLKESTGYVNGNFKITGNVKQPLVIGELNFNAIGFKATQLNANFKSINDKIIFNGAAIVFDTFTIKDENENNLIVDGKIDSPNFRNFGFDLSVVADNFKVVNSEAKDNDLYYGELFLDNKLTITGNLDNPVVEGSVKINKDTKFTIVLPQSDPSIADRQGIVEFIDKDNPQILQKVDLTEISSKSEITGINAAVTIEIDKDAELSMVIDKANGDFLKLKGEAQLSGGIDPSGKTSLTGRYELSEGSYEMNFNAIKRKFDIKKGSYILWTGEPTMADINITAIYKTEAAPIDLVSDQLGAVTNAVRNTYKQKIPFETNLKMTGELMKPTIAFDIILPEGNNSVSTEIINTTQAKLTQLRQQTDKMNKQVFSLIILNRFIGENPFASETGGTKVGSIARESASKILSEQLNNLAGNLIEGVALNFDLATTDDYTTGQRENKTDINIGLSKKLLNDRLTVTVGSSFGIEGPQQTNKNANNIAGDVSLDYQLSKDGRYKMRVYRVNKYQVALQGEVVETGVAFIITLDYNKFIALFSKIQNEKVKNKSNTKSR